MLLTMYILNKAGGLIYHKDLSPVPKQNLNEYLRLASTFHSLHAISKQLAPVPSGGIQVVDAPSFSLHCYETPTGLKFFVTAKPKTENVPQFLRKVYEYYGDYVLKNPFYELDMPIRIKLFDHYLENYVKSTGLGTGSGGPVVATSTSGTSNVSSSSGSSGTAAPMFTGSSSGSSNNTGTGTPAPMFTGSSSSNK